MNQAAEQLQMIDVNIETLERMLDLEAALERLQQNPDYKKIFDEDFFSEECTRLVLLRAAPAAQADPNILKDIEHQITTIGGLYSYFLTIRQRAAQARRDIEADKETRQTLLAEQIDEDAGTLQ